MKYLQAFFFFALLFAGTSLWAAELESAGEKIWKSLDQGQRDNLLTLFRKAFPEANTKDSSVLVQRDLWLTARNTQVQAYMRDLDLDPSELQAVSDSLVAYIQKIRIELQAEEKAQLDSKNAAKNNRQREAEELLDDYRVDQIKDQILKVLEPIRGRYFAVKKILDENGEFKNEEQNRLAQEMSTSLNKLEGLLSSLALKQRTPFEVWFRYIKESYPEPEHILNFSKLSLNDQIYQKFPADLKKERVSQETLLWLLKVFNPIFVQGVVAANWNELEPLFDLPLENVMVDRLHGAKFFKLKEEKPSQLNISGLLRDLESSTSPNRFMHDCWVLLRLIQNMRGDAVLQKGDFNKIIALIRKLDSDNAPSQMGSKILRVLFTHDSSRKIILSQPEVPDLIKLINDRLQKYSHSRDPDSFLHTEESLFVLNRVLEFMPPGSHVLQKESQSAVVRSLEFAQDEPRDLLQEACNLLSTAVEKDPEFMEELLQRDDFFKTFRLSIGDNPPFRLASNSMHFAKHLLGTLIYKYPDNPKLLNFCKEIAQIKEEDSLALEHLRTSLEYSLQLLEADRKLSLTTSQAKPMLFSLLDSLSLNNKKASFDSFFTSVVKLFPQEVLFEIPQETFNNMLNVKGHGIYFRDSFKPWLLEYLQEPQNEDLFKKALRQGRLNTLLDDIHRERKGLSEEMFLELKAARKNAGHFMLMDNLRVVSKPFLRACAKKLAEIKLKLIPAK